jgi:hypothetical protein
MLDQIREHLYACVVIFVDKSELDVQVRPTKLFMHITNNYSVDR